MRGGTLYLSVVATTPPFRPTVSLNSTSSVTRYSYSFFIVEPPADTMTDSQFENIDNIDSLILQILSLDPRAPYSEIAEELEEAGYEMSSEGIRYRVSKLLDTTEVFFLLDPEDISWEIVRIAAEAVDEAGAKDELFEKISEMRLWHVVRGIGTYDVYAVGMAPTLSEIDELVTTIEEYDEAKRVDHIVVTDRESNMEDYYFSPDSIDTTDE